MDMLSLIQSARSQEDVNRLLQAMGQTSTPNQGAAARVPMDPLMMQSSQIGQLLIDNPMSRAQINATLGSAARPTGVAPNTQAPMTQDPYERILRNIALNALDSRSAAIVDAVTGPSGAMGPSPVAPGQPESIAAFAAEENCLGKPEQGQSLLPDPRDTAKAGNTTGGAERVNARTSETGVRAIKDKDGRVTLTNIGEDGQPMAQSLVAPGASPAQTFGKPISGNIQNLLQQVREAKDSATAQGLADSLRTSIVEERMRIEKESREFAEAEVKLPQLRRALTAQQSLDNWRPGMGMGPASLRIQQQIRAAEQLAAGRAKEWLGRNLPYQQLAVTETAAEEAIKLSVQKQSDMERAINLKEVAAEQKEEAKQEQARIEFEGLSPSQRLLITRLNPSLAVAGKEAETVAFAKQQLKTNKDFGALLQAEDEAEQVQLALSGNKLAVQLLAQQEASVTGQDAATIEKELNDFQTLAVDQKALDDYARAAGVRTAEDRKNFMAQFNSLNGPGASKEQQKEGALLKARIKQSILQQRRTQAITGNVLTWAPEGSALQQAAKKSMEINGQGDLKTAITLLTKDKPLEEQTAILNEVKKQMLAQARKYSNSPIAKVDLGQVTGQFDAMVAGLNTLSTADLFSPTTMYRKQMAAITRAFE